MPLLLIKTLYVPTWLPRWHAFSLGCYVSICNIEKYAANPCDQYRPISPVDYRIGIDRIQPCMEQSEPQVVLVPGNGWFWAKSVSHPKNGGQTGFPTLSLGRNPKDFWLWLKKKKRVCFKTGTNSAATIAGNQSDRKWPLFFTYPATPYTYWSRQTTVMDITMKETYSLCQCLAASVYLFCSVLMMPEWFCQRHKLHFIMM